MHSSTRRGTIQANEQRIDLPLVSAVGSTLLSCASLPITFSFDTTTLGAPSGGVGPLTASAEVGRGLGPFSASLPRVDVGADPDIV